MRGTHSGDVPTPGRPPHWSRVPAHLRGRPTKVPPTEFLNDSFIFWCFWGPEGQDPGVAVGRPRGSPWCVRPPPPWAAQA